MYNFVFPCWFEDRLKNSYLGSGIEEYIHEVYQNSPDEFIYQLKKADKTPKGPGLQMKTVICG